MTIFNSNARRYIQRILTLLIAFLFVFTAFSFYAHAGSVSCKRSKLKVVRAKIRAARKHLRIARTRERDMAHQLNRTQNHIRTLRRDIGIISCNMKQSQKEIKQLKKELASLQEKHESQQDIIQKRLRSIYLSGNTKYLALFTGSMSMGDFLCRADNLSNIVARDERMVKTLSLEKSAIDFKQNQIQNKYGRMLSYRGRLKQKRNSLETLEVKRRGLLREVAQKRKEYQREKCELEDHSHDIEVSIQNQIRSYHRNQGYAGSSWNGKYQGSGVYMWPTGGPVTSDFGYRVHPIHGGTRFHTGLDIGAGYGSAIRAADGGVVIYSGWCGGYGNTIIIAHDRGTTTLYGHCSSLCVGNGQAVSKGQTVATVGSTGWSTGPHLHFEVRVDGNPVSPWGYLR